MEPGAALCMGAERSAGRSLAPIPDRIAAALRGTLAPGLFLSSLDQQLTTQRPCIPWQHRRVSSSIGGWTERQQYMVKDVFSPWRTSGVN